MSGNIIYISTVSLDRNRWGSREPSFQVSDWISRFKADGFDGLELWQFHYQSADAEEQARLIELAAPIALYNTYVGFGDGDATDREEAVAAIQQLGACGVKYNLGADADSLEAYRRNLLAWAEALPSTCRPLCECHPGTVLEELDAATAFFEDLDPAHFGIIAHINGEAEGTERWFDAFGPRIGHIHVQFRSPETDPENPDNRDRLEQCFAVLKQHNFSGSMALEFTRGIGRDEDIESIYTNALADLAFCREQLG